MIPLRLSYAHLRHGKLRALLTVLSVSITVFLFCTLRSVVTSLQGLTQGASSTRLVTQSAVSLFVALPVAMWPRLQAIQGVRAATHWTWTGGVYIDPSNFFARFAVDVPSLRRVYGDQAPEGARDMQLDAADWEAFERDRTACIVGAELAARFGFQKGSRIQIQGTIYPGLLELVVAGVYTSASSSFDQATLFFHWTYLNEVSSAAGGPRDVAGTYSLLLDSPDRAGAIMDEVDATFANSPTRTRTYTERMFNQQFVTMWGNVPLLLSVLGAAIVFSCFMITLNTMLLLARERVRETGILKALGFQDSSVAALSLVEAIALCAAGTALGLGLALLLYNRGRSDMGGFLPNFGVTPTTIREAIGLGLLLGVASGLAPAVLAGRLQVVEALRTAR